MKNALLAFANDIFLGSKGRTFWNSSKYFRQQMFPPRGVARGVPGAGRGVPLWRKNPPTVFDQLPNNSCIFTKQCFVFWIYLTFDREESQLKDKYWAVLLNEISSFFLYLLYLLKVNLQGALILRWLNCIWQLYFTRKSVEVRRWTWIEQW